ncbi:hypothetical protein Rahaq_0562 [Rahnella aceris]|uniref:Uncharacterized protein n=1 Tax=Rahnella sp. (strain Y9602) TaxID=2703885 RepID=A0A0H3F8B8_RAHSY|nr:hypothetical protein [Rahnella aceris]ADW72189.1 hypothetical protein Rahaq_0562 [Rahnella aceris]
MEIFNNFVLQTIASTVLSGTLVTCLGWFLRTWFRERIQQSIKNEYDKKLEKFKAEIKTESDVRLTEMKAVLERQSEILKIAATSFSEVQKATISKKIEAVDILWHGIIKFRKEFPASASFTDVLTDKEMCGFYTDQKLRKHSDNLDKFDLNELVTIRSNEVSLVRPHLGEYLWALYSTYSIILIRSIFLLKSGKSDQDKIAWHRDKNIKKLIESAFGNKCLSEFEKLELGRYQWLSNQFESSLFKAIDTLLTGKSFSDAALSQAQLMEKQIISSIPPHE